MYDGSKLLDSKIHCGFIPFESGVINIMGARKISAFEFFSNLNGESNRISMSNNRILSHKTLNNAKK